jgi:hypothetical protein
LTRNPQAISGTKTAIFQTEHCLSFTLSPKFRNQNHLGTGGECQFHPAARLDLPPGSRRLAKHKSLGQASIVLSGLEFHDQALLQTKSIGFFKRQPGKSRHGMRTGTSDYTVEHLVEQQVAQ